MSGSASGSGAPAPAGLDEPVRRFFAHALPDGPPREDGVRLEMRGRIRVGVWLSFAGTWEGDGRSFRWQAAAGPPPLRPLRVIDRFAGGAGSMDVRAFGRLPLVQASDEDVARSGAGRAAIEAAFWAPASLLPDRGVRWRAEGDDVIVATWAVPPEQPEVRLRIGPDGGVIAGSTLRWHGTRDGYVACGGQVQEERRFGGVVIPSRVSVGWWFGTPRYRPFFEAVIVRSHPAR